MPWNADPIIMPMGMNMSSNGTILRNSDPMDMTVLSSVKSVMNWFLKVIRISAVGIMNVVRSLIAVFTVVSMRSYFFSPAFWPTMVITAVAMAIEGSIPIVWSLFAAPKAAIAGVPNFATKDVRMKKAMDMLICDSDEGMPTFSMFLIILGW